MRTPVILALCLATLTACGPVPSNRVRIERTVDVCGITMLESVDGQVYVSGVRVPEGSYTVGQCEFTVLDGGVKKI